MGLDPPARHLGEKTFTADDQQLFALVSKDRNPMHMDALAARKLITGRRIVHGMHVLFMAIEHWRKEDDCRIHSISCTFNSPVSVDDTVVFSQTRQGDDEYAIEAKVNGLLCSQIVIATAKEPVPHGPASDPPTSWTGARSRIPTSVDRPFDEKPEFHLGRVYLVDLDAADFSVHFPHSYLHLGKKRFAAVSALSRFVGMVCPGLHSIFSSLSLELAHESTSEDVLAFRVRKYDHRTRLFDIDFQGCIRGRIRAFLRPAPQVQPSVVELSAHVVPDEFRGTRSLIIGGSRGLGEFTAKLVAAGGGDVVITYARGSDDARRVQDEINERGGGSCESARLDLTGNSFDTLNVDFGALTAVYFFATPRIFRKKAETFEMPVFQEFFHIYVRRFYELCHRLEASASAGRIKVFFPSSVAIAARPRDLAEYAMAKAAAEVLIEDINRSFKRVSVLAVRLPRLSTDQTATVLNVPTESTLATLLPIIRSVTDGGSGARA